MSYLEPDDIFVCEGASKEQQGEALHVGHGCKALQPPHHLLPKSLHQQVTTSSEEISETQYSCVGLICPCVCDPAYTIAGPDRRHMLTAAFRFSRSSLGGECSPLLPVLLTIEQAC